MAATKSEKELRVFKVIDKRNFNGFLHPTTRKFIAQKDGVFKIDAADAAAIKILEKAADVTEVTDLMK